MTEEEAGTNHEHDWMTWRASALLALLAPVVAPVVALAAMPATIGRADPGEEPGLAIEVVGLKAGSNRDVMIRVMVRGSAAGKAAVVGSANHDRALDEITVDNNMKTFDLTVQ